MTMTLSLLKERILNTKSMLADNALLIIAPPELTRNRTVHYGYRQHSLLHYLTGFNEPESALIINPSLPLNEQTILFVRSKDPARELWEGKRLGVERALEYIPADRVFPISELWQQLPMHLKNISGLYYDLGNEMRNDQLLIPILKSLRNRTKNAILSIHDPDIIAGQLRWKKSHHEIELMEKAAHITSMGFKKVLGILKPGIQEQEIHGCILGEFLAQGAEMEAYSSIIAGGANACTLHYTDNNQVIADGQLVLIDAGAQYNYMACDVTRTFPVSRILSGAQRDIYSLVLESQKQAIALAKPGTTLDILHQKTVAILSQGLIDLKILQESLSTVIEKNLYKPFFPHNTSHWLGMDVHDVGLYKDMNGVARNLEPGCYFTVEPGLYFDPNLSEPVPEHFKGIGIRIEDDILITMDGARVITHEIPKEIKDIER